LTTQELTGTVTYVERIALPPAAEIRVALVDAGLRVLAEQVQALGERQVPVPFAIGYAAEIDEYAIYALRAEIRVEGRVAFASPFDVLVLSGGNPSSDVELRVRPPSP
jgi:uncharacterized lipoprotein YbaY